jgi:hypothetical protein
MSISAQSPAQLCRDRYVRCCPRVVSASLCPDRPPPTKCHPFRCYAKSDTSLAIAPNSRGFSPETPRPAICCGIGTHHMVRPFRDRVRMIGIKDVDASSRARHGRVTARLGSETCKPLIATMGGSTCRDGLGGRVISAKAARTAASSSSVINRGISIKTRP